MVEASEESPKASVDEGKRRPCAENTSGKSDLGQGKNRGYSKTRSRFKAVILGQDHSSKLSESSVGCILKHLMSWLLTESASATGTKRKRIFQGHAQPWIFKKFDHKIKDFYNRLRAQGKPPKSALLAVMRKLIVILNSKMRLFYEGKNYF